jgi:glycosyltransferase involved in cell wall biosynthesis
MRALIWSNAPYIPSGYGKQAMHAGTILKSLGHEVAYIAYSGHGGTPIKWEGSTIFPSGMLDFSLDVICQHAQLYQPGLLILLGDLWKLEPVAVELSKAPCKIAAFAIMDASPLPPSYHRTLAKLQADGVAVSSWGQQLLKDNGFEDAACLPHCTDTSIYKPQDRAQIRTEIGVPRDAFLIGICGANSDIMRKGYAEQFAAFQRFLKRHQNAHLMIMSVTDSPRGLHLVQMANDMGIAERVHFTPTYEQVSGMISEEYMSGWFNSLDLLSMASYGEGFGVPAIEAMACGTPVAGTDCSAIAELVSPHGFLIKGTRYWNGVHRAWWTRPSEDSILAAWQQAYADRKAELRRENCVKQAQQYSVRNVQEIWDGYLQGKTT